MPKLSIIIPCYNSEKFIGQTIQSVIDQSYQDFELLIINDGSSDNSICVIENYQLLDSRIKSFTIENSGVNKARNFGFSKSSNQSRYLHFLDSDDILQPNFYDELVFFLEHNQDFGTVYCNHIFINDLGIEVETPNWGGRLIPTRFWMHQIPENVIETPFISIALWCKMVEPMVVIRKSIYEISKQWDERFYYGRGGEGVVLFTELATLSKVGYLNKKLFKYRRHVSQSSQNKIRDFDAFDFTSKKILENCRSKEGKFFLRFVFKRSSVFSISKSLKHELRYNQLKFIVLLIQLSFFYFLSIPLCFYSAKSTNRLF